MDRRQFIKWSSFFTTTALTSGLSGCFSDNTIEPELPAAATGDGWKFPQSIASADPKPDSIVLWTRVVPLSLSDTATLPAGTQTTIRLLLTSADNSAALGSNAALSGSLLMDQAIPAYAAFDGSIRHKVTGLNANTTYFYQFVAGNVRSNVGRFKTAPASNADVAQLKFAFIACQDWSINHWGGYDYLAQNEELDFFLHLGDYIYETVGEAFQTGLVEARHSALNLPNGTYKNGSSGAKYATTVEDYRYLYKQYRTDRRLQAVHERFAMIAVWDDHEFSDDCWKDAETYDNGSFDATLGLGDNTHQESRRRNANRAWYEFMPADIWYDETVRGANTIKIYRDFKFGKLAHLVMTDERLYRTDHVIPEAAPNPATGQPIGSIGARYMVPAAKLAEVEAAKIVGAQKLGLDALGLTSIIPDMDPTRPAKADPRKLHAAIKRFGITQLFGSPALMRVLAEHGEPLPTVKRVTSAGAPVPPEVVSKMLELLPPDAQLWTPYGATECLPVAIIEGRELLTLRERTEQGAGTCVGRAVPPNEVRLIRVDDAAIERWSDDLVVQGGLVGEITVAGPTATDEYFGREAQTRLAKIRETLPDGTERIVHRMGDLGYFDAEGRLWFCGRKTQRVVTADTTLCTEQIEPVFNAHPDVRRTALVGLGAFGAQRPVLCVELRAGVAASEWPRIESELRHLGEGFVHTAQVATFLHHPKPFPVDIRHNAKIGREKLAAWAVARIR